MKKPIRTLCVIGMALAASYANAGLINETAGATFGATPTVKTVVVADSPATTTGGSSDSKQEMRWSLVAGKPIHDQLKEWALAAGWEFNWKTSKSWIVPANVEFSGSFDKAIEAVVVQMYEQGAPIRLQLWEGNRFAEIIDADIR